MNQYQENSSTCNEKIKEISEDLKITHDMNNKLLKEIEEKDKLISLSEKKCYDYEIMINKIQDEANKELDEKTKHDMIRAKDTEIYNREQEILRLQKNNNELQEKLDHISDKNEDKEYYENLWKTESKNSFSNDPEKVKIAIDGYQKHTNFLNVTDKEVGHTSLGINGWYLDSVKQMNEKKNEKTLVNKIEGINKVQDVQEEINNPVVTEVVEEIDEKSGETTEELSDVDDNKKEDDIEEESTEEECTVATIKHYGKEYYIIDGEDPQYIYSIDNGELGKEVGEMKNGKKHMYKK